MTIKRLAAEAALLPVKFIQKNKSYKALLELIRRLNFLSIVSFSQNAEDYVVMTLIDKLNGFYVDVGAHDPVKISNTYQLYLRGWHGINIDPLPQSMKRFAKYRPSDINLNIGIASEPGEIEYYNFFAPEFNTTNPVRAQECLANGDSELKEKIAIQVDRLDAVLDKNLNGNKIDFLNIDVESRELDVLKSNNWDKYRPSVIAVEILGSSNTPVIELESNPLVSYMSERDYKITAKVGHECFFMDMRSDMIASCETD